MKQIYDSIKNLLVDRFSLSEDSAHDSEIIESISRNVEFRGSNLWSLIFAIFIASIGLNVNSTAVVIGAMLVSPLMGPIMGIGLGMGINDIYLIRRASKNLLIAVVISIVVSTFYFYITPLHDAQSELLARTTPTIWDVFIALFGGLAGIVGGTRKEKGNVIPGVAIATALMPPLCTAGYGLAVGNMYYFLGAIYLFFINSIFICLSSFLIVRYLKLPKKAFEDEAREKRVMKYIIYIAILTVLPSIYLAYKIVDKSIFESNASNFIKNEFNFKKSHIINKSFKYEGSEKEIELLVIGDDLPPDTIESLKQKLAKYNIPKTKLVISQGLNAKQKIDFTQIKASILEEVFSKQAETAKSKTPNASPMGTDVCALVPELRNELHALYPAINGYSITRSVIYGMDTTVSDTVLLFLGNVSKPLPRNEQKKFQDWLKQRLAADSVVLVIQTVK